MTLTLHCRGGDGVWVGHVRSNQESVEDAASDAHGLAMPPAVITIYVVAVEEPRPAGDPRFPYVGRWFHGPLNAWVGPLRIEPGRGHVIEFDLSSEMPDRVCLALARGESIAWVSDAADASGSGVESRPAFSAWAPR